MLLTNIICIIIILLNLSGLVYLMLIAFRNIAFNLNQNISKIPARPKPANSDNKDGLDIIEKEIIKKKEDMLDDLDLSDFDDLNLDDFD